MPSDSRTSRETRADNDNRVAMAYAHFIPPSLARLARTTCPRATKKRAFRPSNALYLLPTKLFNPCCSWLPHRCRRWVFFRDAPFHNICATSAQRHAQRTTSMRVALLLLLPHAHPSIMESTSKRYWDLARTRERTSREAKSAACVRGSVV